MEFDQKWVGKKVQYNGKTWTVQPPERKGEATLRCTTGGAAICVSTSTLEVLLRPLPEGVAETLRADVGSSGTVQYPKERVPKPEHWSDRRPTMLRRALLLACRTLAVRASVKVLEGDELREKTHALYDAFMEGAERLDNLLTSPDPDFVDRELLKGAVQ